jgi:hypothetical protein
MPAFLALLRTDARLKDQLELDVRLHAGLTVARYDCEDEGVPFGGVI